MPCSPGARAGDTGPRIVHPPRVLALALASCFAPLPPAVPAAVEALARGDAAHAAFDLEAARREYATAVALDPDGVEARARLAHALNDIGEEAPEERARGLFEEALALAEQLQRDAPDRPEGHYAAASTRGNLMRFLSGPEKVRSARRIEEAARRASQLDPCLAPALAVLAITYRELSSLSGLVRAVARAALGGLPRGTLEDAEWMLRAATALDPRDPFNHYELALTLEEQGRPQEAASELERAMALPDREPRDRRNRADALRRIERLRRD